MKQQQIKLIKLSYGHYQLGKCDIQFSMNSRYDLFDGKYHPGWVVTVPGIGTFDAIDKKHAITIAIAKSSIKQSLDDTIQSASTRSVKTHSIDGTPVKIPDTER